MFGPFPASVTAPELVRGNPQGPQYREMAVFLSINDGVEPELCSLTYTIVDQAAKIVTTLKIAALMAKVDIESAFRLVPIHPHDHAVQ